MGPSLMAWEASNFIHGREKKKSKTKHHPWHSHSFNVILRVVDRFWRSLTMLLSSSWLRPLQPAHKIASEIWISSDQFTQEELKWFKILHFHKEERRLEMVKWPFYPSGSLPWCSSAHFILVTTEPLQKVWFGITKLCAANPWASKLACVINADL